MRIFKQRIPILILTAFIFELLFLTAGCGKISQGLQRRKFEFLYRMNNDVSLLKEYTAEISRYEDLDFYEQRMNKFYADVNKLETVNGYGESRILKEDLMKLIDDNIRSVNVLRMKQFPPGENLSGEYEILSMKEKVYDFLDRINEEIIRVGKD